VDKGAVGEEELMMLVLDAGAEDLQDGGEVHEIIAPMVGFEAVKQALEEKGIASTQASLAWLPQNMLAVESKDVEPIINLLEALDDLDDVQKVYSNFDAPEADLQRLLASA
jgi:transcriptional/translational regulatory protein YebC/TACO1